MPVKKGNAKNILSEYSEGKFLRNDESYKQLLELCYQICGERNTIPLEAYSREFIQATDHISKEIDDFKSKIASIPFIAVILVWAGFVERDKVFGSRYVDMMRELILIDIIPNKNAGGKSLTMHEFNSFNFIAIIDAIRCNTKWLEHKREDYVNFFIEFLNWLSEVTFGYVSKVQDPDRQFTLRRQLPYETYIKIITSLSTCHFHCNRP